MVHVLHTVKFVSLYGFSTLSKEHDFCPHMHCQVLHKHKQSATPHLAVLVQVSLQHHLETAVWVLVVHIVMV